MKRHDTVIIGGGQAGLAMSHHLTQRGRDHLILERDRLGGRWHDERWDLLHYQFPNWSLRLPGHRYQADDPGLLALFRGRRFSIIWCTGYRPAFDWIEIPVFDLLGAPIQQRGVTSCPGLYFLGLHWMHSFKSGALFGVGDDAEFIADLIAR